MLPYLVAAIVVIGLPVRYCEYRKFLAGAFFVSSGMLFYFYLPKIPIPQDRPSRLPAGSGPPLGEQL
jgi:hypothetical protein